MVQPPRVTLPYPDINAIGIEWSKTVERAEKAESVLRELVSTSMPDPCFCRETDRECEADDILAYFINQAKGVVQ